jgi:acetoacetate decarboxylase
MVEYLADPAAVAAFLPPGLEPGDRPGLAAAIFGDWSQGYPKTMGNIGITRAFGIGRATPKDGAGARFAGTLATGDRRLVEARVTLTAPAPEPALMLAPLVHSRCFPSWDPATAGVDELVTGGSTDQQIDDVWAGDAELTIFDSPHDEVSLLKPVEVLGGYRFSFAETITGGRLLSATGR